MPPVIGVVPATVERSSAHRDRGQDRARHDLAQSIHSIVNDAAKLVTAWIHRNDTTAVAAMMAIIRDACRRLHPLGIAR